MARIEVEIEDYLDEIDDKYLIKELKKRKYNVVLSEYPEYPKFDTPDELLTYIKGLLGLKPWHGKEQIIKEISEL